MNRTKSIPVTTQPRSAKRPHGVYGGTSEANRLAVVILEVLAGIRTPLDAAAVLGIAPPRYYQLEVRALEGLVAALEPRPKGKQPSAEGRITQMEKALQQAQRECMRQQALVRAAQRSLGIKPSLAADGKPPGKDKAGRRKRRPTVRALKAVRVLAQAAPPPERESLQLADRGAEPAESAPHGNGAPPGGTFTLSEGAGG
jgi:hypothetical protein